MRRWTDDILPLVVDDDDPLGTEDFATHQIPLTEAPEAYAIFQRKEDGVIKVLMQPHGPEAAGAKGIAKASVAA